jgi:integrase
MAAFERLRTYAREGASQRSRYDRHRTDPSERRSAHQPPRELARYVVQNVRGGRISRQRVAKIVREASTLWTEKRSARGLPPLPRTTPHSLRRTYIPIALLANRFDVKWVMSQVGHADSKMTLDVDAQLEQRVKREHGVRFDALVRDARVQLHGALTRPEKATKRRRGAGRPGITARDE